MRRTHQLLLPLLAVLFLSSCQIGETQIPALWRPLPEQPLYALRGGWHYSDNFNNALFIIDPTTWTVLRRVQLPRALSPQIDQDPRGRIWIGLGTTGSFLPDAKGMLVLSRGGSRIAKLDTCIDPIAGVEFDETRAYVVCALNGFSAQIDVFELETLKKVDSLSFDGSAYLAEQDLLTLDRSGGTALLDNYLLIQGSPDYIDWGVDIATRILTLIDVTNMDVVDQTNAMPGVALLNIFPYQGKFIGLNAAREEHHEFNGSPINTAETSLFIIEPGTPMKIERRPLALTNAARGAIDGDTLYILHHGTRSEPTFDPETGDPLGIEIQGEFIPYTDDTSWQALSTYNLASGDIELLWQQDIQISSDINDPSHPRASDIAVIDDEIILVSSSTDHIYRWDRVRNVMQPLLALEEAGTLLLGNTK